MLGAPTSIAFESVATEARASYFPESSHSGIVRFEFVAAIKPRIGAPIFFAIRPEVRFPKLPDGTVTISEAESILLSCQDRSRMRSEP